MSSLFKVQSLKFKLGEYADLVDKAISKANEENLVERIWKQDHTVWNPKPDEIDNRLGWLDVADRMRSEVTPLEKFANDAKDEGFTQALLLGMGGSSLAPEVFSRLLGSKQGLQLSVLDSTDPDAVRAAEANHDPCKTLYIVSTKSGGTVETLSLFKYFYNQAQAILGEKVGNHFVAITDPGSGLEKLAKQYSFRKIFLADPNIGGRYSALSHFGIVAAALAGSDLPKLFDGARAAETACKKKEVEENPCAMLGLVVGTLANAGRDKVTFVAASEIAEFGNWVEQLIAESTGKNGTGILPVVGEPAAKVEDYGNDRVFVFLHLGNKPPNGPLHDSLINSPHPVVEVFWEDVYDLGKQFFLWEFAVAVAGHVMGIHPFDQPNVEAAKIQGRAFVEEYAKTGKLPKGDIQPVDAGTFKKFLRIAKAGDYIALKAFAAASPQVTNDLNDLRAGLLHQHKLATTAGYGPRFLHSTGQLHKGDAGHGLFIQFVTAPPKDDLPIPDAAGKPASSLSFGVLKFAQALGDAEALRQAGRRVLSFEIDGDLHQALRNLLKELNG